MLAKRKGPFPGGKRVGSRGKKKRKKEKRKKKERENLKLVRMVM